MGLVLQRVLKHGDVEPGTYSHDDVGTVIGCIKCGDVYALLHGPAPGMYQVALDGRVTPAVSCLSCQWSEWLTLESWQGGVPM